MTASAIVCVSHGSHIRIIVYSPFFEHLVRKAKVVVVLPMGVKFNEQDTQVFKGAEIVKVSIRPHRYEHIFNFLRKSVFAGRRRTLTFNLFSALERQKHPILYPVAWALNSVLGRIPIAGKLWLKLESLLVPGFEFDNLINNGKPDVIITANYGTEPFEVRLLRSAHRHDVPTLSIVPSWDNLSSKGVIGEKPNNLIVWNKIMRDEARSLYDFQDAEVHVCGGLQFDRYAAPQDETQRLAILNRLGIDCNQPFVLVGTMTPRYFEHNVDIVDIINEAVESGRLPANLQVVVRVHPQVVDDPHFGDDLAPYRLRAAKYSRVKLSIPRVLSWGQITPPSPDDGAELMALLKSAAVSVTPASTLAIDACAVGTPVIGVGFDGFTSKPYESSMRRMFDFTYYSRLVAQGGLRVVETAEQLVTEINAYMDDGSRDRDGRSRVVESQLGTLDGKAWQRALRVVETASRSRL